MSGELAACLESEFHDPFATGERDVIEKLYVAGPMTGYPESNYPEFNRIAALLREAGFTVVNPAECLLDKPGHYIDFLREDLRAMLDCHGVAVLDGWTGSVGARNEVQVAEVLKMPVKRWTDWMENNQRAVPYNG